MYRLKESIHINAPIDRCFLLATSIPLVAIVLKMRPVKGKKTGLIVNGDIVRWRGWKWGIPQMHETLITKYERPNYFQDTMRRGRFSFFKHDHYFRSIDGHTLCYDQIFFSMYLGPIGNFFADKVLVPYMMELLRWRLRLLRRIAEGPNWERYLDGVIPEHDPTFINATRTDIPPDDPQDDPTP